ncbi:MAG TPA: hypothetical protein VNT60_04540, partial [Deinococcales bacterium]|nr:hypothetical protein [Deinococcales bacterium]
GRAAPVPPTERAPHDPWEEAITEPRARAGSAGANAIARWLSVVSVLAAITGLAGAYLESQDAISYQDYLAVTAWALAGLFALLAGLGIAAALRALAPQAQAAPRRKRR